MDLSPENHERATRDGIVVPFRVDLPKGRYQLHVGANDATGGRAGTVRHDIDVPDFGVSPLSFSTVVLAVSDVSSPPFVRKMDDLQTILGQPPTLVREFSPSTTINAGAQVYGASAAVAVLGELRTIDGTVVRTTACHVESGSPSSETVCALSLPLTGVPAGNYSLRFAEDAAGKRVESAPVFFTIRWRRPPL